MIIRRVISSIVTLVLVHQASAANRVCIVQAAKDGGLEQLAVRETRRYLYVRTGELVEITASLPADADAMVIGRKDRDIVQQQAGEIRSAIDALKPQEYLIKSVQQGGRHRLLIVGGDELGTLYGAYRFAEHLGVRFYMEGDVIPDEPMPLAIPTLDDKGSPLFELRGIQPFHDFPEGPDWWDTDLYLAIISQLPKMRMNFFGLHTYPEGGVGPEPVVWIGTPDEVGADGRVKASYPSRHCSTVGGTWGYQSKKTSAYSFGAAMLFDDDAFCQDVQRGLTPWPATPEQCNDMFNRFGDKLRTAFTHAQRLGVKTCIGTETPLLVPAPVRQRLKPNESGLEVVGGQVANYGSPIDGTEDDVIYQSVRFNLQAYRFTVPDDEYKVVLRFCEIAYDAAGKRVFGVKVQGTPVVDGLDIFAKAGKNKAWDVVLDKVKVADGKLAIEFVGQTEYPCISAIDIIGPRTLRIDCGASTPYKGYLSDDGRPPLNRADIERLYTGMFQRIMRTHPLDYYWFWTPENWTWSGVSEDEVRRTMDDLHAAIAAAGQTKATFGLATCGWVLGPQTNRALFDRDLPRSMAVSCINRAVGHDAVEPAFAEVQGRGKWAIPWLEDDPALLSPQLWAGRMRKDAADALAYGCTGLMGIHWRTRILGPNVSALAAAAWNQSSWPEPVQHMLGADGGAGERFENAPIEGTNDDVVYQTQRTGLHTYCVPAPNGRHTVALQFCELVHAEKGKRVFSVRIQGQPALNKLDIFAEAGRGKLLEKKIGDVKVIDGWITVEFIPEIGATCLSAVRDEGPYGANSYNVGGPAHGSFAGDFEPRRATGRYAPTQDFYLDWARQQFGEEVAVAAGELFSRIDDNLPRPSNWINGPGGLFPDPRPWAEVRKEYAFVDTLEGLRPQVNGAGNLERFDYWLDTLKHLRSTAKVDCIFARQNVAMAELKKLTDAAARKDFARKNVLPIRLELIEALGEAYRDLLATVTNPSELGTIANWEQHSLPSLLTVPGEELAAALGIPLPAEAMPSSEFSGKPRLIVPTVLTSIDAGRPLTLRVVVLDREPREPVVCWREMGGKQPFEKVAARHLGRAVYEATILPGGVQRDVEYYVEAGALKFPATAPKLNQTVIVTPAAQ